MKKYDTIAILRPDVTDDYLATLSKKVEKAIGTKPGELIKKEDWGVKKLAYEVKKNKQGRYIYWHYMQAPKALPEIDKKLRFEENVLRSVTIVIDEKTSFAKQAARQAKGKMENPAPTPDSADDGGPRMKRRGRGEERLAKVDYKDPLYLARFINERGKILPRRVSGIDTVSQRAIAIAIKRARQLALLAYTEGFYIPREQPVAEERERGPQS
jgi:small subunit ribosomal protein S6